MAKNKVKPFIVESEGQQITVLGTHFNISAYKGEGIRTTLLEGSVKVSSFRGKRSDEKSLGHANSRDLSYRRDDGQGVVLKPNQQSLITGNNQINVSPANIEETMAWKNGYFRFNDEKLATIMAKISRWYNVDVQFEGGLPTVGFNGTISRYKNITQVLKMLEATHEIRFKLEGKKIMVYKQL
ncbi:hypothetical protein D3C86_1670310 [compost metagenome]